ncbi:hypothetical protein ONZ45_g5403 [Pleurotus djamor]|nr:hypothetical protein ONZ45_g5403 [Pleurotus djamor]
MSFQDIPDSAALTLYLQGTYPPVASACLFLYDYLITLGDEVHHIWGTRGGTGKLLFMLTRYLTFGDIALAVYRNTSYFLTESTCRTLYEVSGAFAIAGIIIAERFAYYAILSLVSILNVVFVSSGSRELANLLMAPQRVLHSILSARMILRLREDSFRRQLCDTVTQPLGESIFLPTIYTPTISPADELTTRGTLDFDGGVDLGRCYRHEDRKQCHNGCYSRPKPGGFQ